MNFKFHPIGFGLFYSGNIGDFKFIYDCGARLKKIINKCIEEEFKICSKLDLLTISHFHYDHVSGVEKLLNTVQIDTIILPYITPKERLKCWLIYLKENRENFSSWYEKFLIDPIETLSENNKINTIILIADEQLDYKKSNDTSQPEDETNIFVSTLPSAKNVALIKKIENITNKQKVFIKRSGEVNLNKNNYPVWIFNFYYCKFESKQTEYMDSILKLNKIDSNQDITKEVLKNIIQNTRFYSVAKRCKLSSTDVNNTSLLLYHSPAEKVFITQKGGNNSLSPYFATFLTGDVNLKEKHAEILKHYGKKNFNKILFFQVPHHGSIKNWNSKIFSQSNHKHIFYIISSESKNKKGLHPNDGVLKDIVKKKGYFCWCTEKCACEFFGFYGAYLEWYIHCALQSLQETE